MTRVKTLEKPRALHIILFLRRVGRTSIFSLPPPWGTPFWPRRFPFLRRVVIQRNSELPPPLAWRGAHRWAPASSGRRRSAPVGPRRKSWKSTWGIGGRTWRWAGMLITATLPLPSSREITIHWKMIISAYYYFCPPPFLIDSFFQNDVLPSIFFF